MTRLAPSDAVPGSSRPARVPTVVVVDADDRTRESLVGLLGVRGRSHVVGSAGRVAEAVSLVRSAAPDVVVVDPRLPDLEQGLTLIRTLRGVDPAVRILVVSRAPALEPQVRAAGADAFILKTFRPTQLADAVARCAQGLGDGDATTAPAPDE